MEKNHHTISKLIAWTPTLLLVVIFTNLLIQIIHINTIDYEKIKNNVKDYLGKSEIPVDIKEEDDEKYFEYNEGRYGGTINDGKIFMNFSDEDYSIYVFGGSSIVNPSQKKVFPYYLESDLENNTEKEINVLNFGSSGRDLQGVKENIIHSIEIKKPDLIIIYSGHNDYQNAYIRILKPKFYLLSNNFILNNFLKIYSIGNERRAQKIKMIDGKIVETAENLGVLQINHEKLREIDEIILNNYVQNMNDITEIAQNNSIPIIFVTPLSNLELKPIGTIDVTGKFYELGRKEGNYTKKIEYLKKARDYELFSFIIRSKSELNENLRNLKEKDIENLYVFDLEKKIIRSSPKFSGYFVDGAHLNPEGHKIVSGYLKDFIIEKSILD